MSENPHQQGAHVAPPASSEHTGVVIESESRFRDERHPAFQVKCAECRHQPQIARDTQEEAEADHAAHIAAFDAITVSPLRLGDRLEFDGKSTSWLVRATACRGRYAIATASIFGVYYTIIDRLLEVRGAMNVVGGSVGIDTRSGPDTGIDQAVHMLEGRPRHIESEFYGDPYDPDAWGHPYEVSHRNRVPLNITRHIPAPVNDAARPREEP